MPPMPMPPMPPMPAATTKPSATTAVAESAERQAPPQRALVLATSAVGGAAAETDVSQATATDSDLPELKAFGQRWGLW